MFTATTFRELVSGRRRGLGAAALRALLRLAEAPYCWAVNRRNRAFDSGRRPVHRVGVPVVSVGNLTLGGTGKTPMVEWLARWLTDRGLQVAIVSRGYKAVAGSRNDEARQLEQTLPGVVHLQNADRVAAARVAVEQLGCRAIVLDDAFQHRRIHRDLDIVLLDAMEPFGFDHVFPRGTLREPLTSLARASLVVLSRADMVDELERTRIRGVVESIRGAVDWVECRHAAQHLRSSSGQEDPLGTLATRCVAAFCGLGNPAGFRHTLGQCRYNVVGWREFPDHFAYGPGDVQSLTRWARELQADALVCTHKDLVKLPQDELDGIPLRAVIVGMEFMTGREQLETALTNLLHAQPRQ